MAAYAYIDVFCDDCGNWSHGESTSKSNARKNVRKRGFVYVRRNGQMVDLCPSCAIKQGYEIDDKAIIEVSSQAMGGFTLTADEFRKRHELHALQSSKVIPV